MDGKTHKSQRRQALAAKVKAEHREQGPPDSSKTSPRKSRHVDRTPMPLLVAGKEVLGRQLSVFKNSNKNPVWVKGAVKAFDAPSVRHKVQYESPLPEVQKEQEEWLSLGKSMFMWLDEDWVCPHANPTYSLKLTPKEDDAVGKRIKVFWTAMGKWYQGKVVEYDRGSGKHRVSFRDGDEKRCILRQEALVWLDIPELSSEGAIKKMREKEGPPVATAVLRGNENKSPAADAEQGSSNSQKRPLDKVKSAGHNKRKQQHRSNGPCRETSQSEAQSQEPAHTSEKSSRSMQRNPPQTSGEKSGRANSEARTAASGSKEAPATRVGIERDADTCTAGPGQPVDDSKSASSSSDEADKGTADKRCSKTGADQSSAALPDGQRRDEGPIKLKFTLNAAKAADDASRKRSRLGLPALVGTAQIPGQPDAKRRPLSKLGKAPSKGAKKPALKKPAEESRLGVRRLKSAEDAAWEEASQAVMGTRVEVWWEDDHCYYKGKLIAHDWYHKRLKVLYDDGYEEFVCPSKPDTKYQWLTPRARTAGATDTVHAAFKLLQAANAVPSSNSAAHEAAPHVPMVVTPPPVAAGAAGLSHTVDGSHLDALVPLRPSSGMGGAKLEDAARHVNGVALTATAVAVPHPVDSTTRAMPAPVKLPGMIGVATPAGWPGAPLRGSIAGTPASSGRALPGLLASIIPSGSHALTAKPAEGLTAATLLQQMSAAAQKGGAAAAAAGTAVGLQQAAQAGVPAQRLAGAVDRRFAMTPEPGAPVAHQMVQPVPQGQAAEGWKVSLVFRGNNQIHQGRILAYSAEKGRHQVLWDDGEDEWIDATKEPLKWHQDRLKTTGFSAGLPAGQVIPKGHDLEGWRIAVYWKDEHTFYEGTVEEYDSELDQHTVSYNDGDELCESLCGQIFKFILPPTVQQVRTRRGCARKRATSSDGEGNSSDHRPRRRPRASHDSDSDDDWGQGLGLVIDRKPSHRHLSHLQREASTPAVATPRTCDIRRLNSKVGSLLVYEGEDNHVDATPGNSPTFAASAGAAVKQELLDPRGLPVLTRRTTSLKSAQGFRVSVKRVRLYLPGGKPALSAEPLKPSEQQAPEAVETAGPEAAGTQANGLPTEESLKQILDRVEMAQQSIQKGIPAGLLSQPSTNGEQPASPSAAMPPSPPAAASPRPAAAPIIDSVLAQQSDWAPAPAANAGNVAPPADTQPAAEERREVADEPGSPTEISRQEEHLTPPPSPFATFAGREHADAEEALPPEALQPGSRDLSEGEVPSDAPPLSKASCEASRAVPVLAIGSLSLPQTPSAISEAHVVAPSRNGSIISAPILAELAAAKAAVARPAAVGGEDVAAA